METYANAGGDSNIHAFEIGYDYIRVIFRGGGTYLYNHVCPGNLHVEKMKLLAKQGQGLNEYINTYVKDSYAEKEV